MHLLKHDASAQNDPAVCYLRARWEEFHAFPKTGPLPPNDGRTPYDSCRSPQPEIIALYEKAARAGSVYAALWMAWSYEVGRAPFPKDADASARWLKEALFAQFPPEHLRIPELDVCDKIERILSEAASSCKAYEDVQTGLGNGIANAVRRCVGKASPADSTVLHERAVQFGETLIGFGATWVKTDGLWGLKPTPQAYRAAWSVFQGAEQAWEQWYREKLDAWHAERDAWFASSFEHADAPFTFRQTDWDPKWDYYFETDDRQCRLWLSHLPDILGLHTASRLYPKGFSDFCANEPYYEGSSIVVLEELEEYLDDLYAYREDVQSMPEVCQQEYRMLCRIILYARAHELTVDYGLLDCLNVKD